MVIRQRGAVTAEVAIALPSLVLLLALLLGAATAGLTQLRLEEAARAGAREVVRGESTGQVQTTVRRLAGGNVQLDLVSDGSWSTVTVTSRLAVPLLDQLGWELSASATARSELQSEESAPTQTGTAGRYHLQPEAPIGPDAPRIGPVGPVATAGRT